LPAYDPLAKPFTVQTGQAVDLGDVPMQRQATQPGSIGATLRADSGTAAMVVSLIPGGPAETAGVRLGDGIAAVDGKPVASVSEAVSRLQGAPGSAVQVTLQRSGVPLTVRITRAP
jgi:C-terminal processing protease CtpA/Prc